VFAASVVVVNTAVGIVVAAAGLCLTRETALSKVDLVIAVGAVAHWIFGVHCLDAS
jgi:hypothetical protein